MEKKIYLYVGTFTRPAPYLEQANGKGIYIYEFDPTQGKLQYLSEVHGIDSPSFLTLDQSGHYLYANSEIFGWDEGLVKAYAVNRNNGSLEYINMQPSCGALTSYISVDSTNRYVFVTNYWTGSVVLYRRKCDGGLSQVVEKIQHQGHGINSERQEGPHTHCVVTDATNTFVYVTDLGLDKIFCYRLDKRNDKLIFASETILQSGCGPRHFVFHPSGRFAYTVCELDSTVVAMTFDSTTGNLSLNGSYKTIPNDFTDVNCCSDIHITASGEFLYAGNRGHDSLAIFKIDQSNGALQPIGQTSTLGQTPRNFAIDPSDAYLLVANQNSDNIKIFTIEKDNGRLCYTGNSIAVPTPACLKFLRI